MDARDTLINLYIMNFTIRILAISVIIFGINCTAYTQENTEPKQLNYFVGGTANYSHSTNDRTPNGVGTTFVLRTNITETIATSYSFAPQIGRRISDHILTGIRFSYGKSKSEIVSQVPLGQITVSPWPTNPDQELTPLLFANMTSQRCEANYYGSIFLRYIVNPKNKLQFYAEPSLSYSVTNSDHLGAIISNERIDETIESKAGFLSIGMGLMYSISDRFRLVSRFGRITYEKGTSEVEIKRTQIEVVDVTVMLAPQLTLESIDFSSFTTDFKLSNIQFGVEYLF